MADAKSRYEIVDGLVERKTTIIEDIARLELTVNNRESQLSNLKVTHTREQETLKRKQKENLEDEIESLAVLKKNVETQTTKLNEKVTALNEAIDAIKAISGNN